VRCEYLGIADFLLIAEAVLGIPAEALAHSHHVIARAESALSAPAAAFDDREFYPQLAEKAAVLCSRILRNHPLPDGNKRVGFLRLIEFVERNGYAWTPPPAGDAESVDVIVRLAASTLSEASFVEWVTARLRATSE
jgi:death on curing protein